MKAIVCEASGPPDVLQFKDVEKPTPGDGEVLIKVHAATVNRTDCAILRSKPFILWFVMRLFKPRKPILGTEFAGMVEAIGKTVSSFKVGDRVFGFDDMGVGSHAQYMTIREADALATIPADTSYEQAAASIEGAHYAYNFINKVQLSSGDKVLVNGATGGIGSAAVQLLKHFGVVVTAVCNEKDFALVKSLGASRVIDYTKEDFTKDHERYHHVFDSVGKSSFAKCKPLLLPGGAYISSELGFLAQNVFFALLKPIMGSKKVIFPLPLDRPGSVALIKGLLEKGEFKAVIDRTYPLEEAADAFRYVEMGQKIGNVVIIVGHDD